MTGTEPNAVTDPCRGEVWLARLGAASDGEPGKNRPVIIIQVDDLAPYAPTDLIPVVPLSASRRPSPASIPMPVVDGINRPCVAVCRAIRGISRARLLRQIAVTPPTTMSKIDSALSRVLGLSSR